MHAIVKITAAVATCLAVAMLTVMPASAKCKNFGFLVNDYGKEGPTKDAKRLLDKHIAEWAAENGIKNYKVGKKTVTCELFLDFIVFDEHTCTARANVCWGGSSKKKKSSSNQATSKKAVSKAAAKKDPEPDLKPTQQAEQAVEEATTTAATGGASID